MYSTHFNATYEDHNPDKVWVEYPTYQKSVKHGRYSFESFLEAKVTYFRKQLKRSFEEQHSQTVSKTLENNFKYVKVYEYLLVFICWFEVVFFLFEGGGGGVYEMIILNIFSNSNALKQHLQEYFV